MRQRLCRKSIAMRGALDPGRDRRGSSFRWEDVVVYWVRGSMVAGRRLAMNNVHGWFSDNEEWIEFIIATFVLWLLMMTAISVFDLRSAG